MSVHQPVTIGHYTHCANCLEAWPCHLMVAALKRQKERNLPSDQDLVFPGRDGGPRTTANTRRQFRDARQHVVKDGGVPDGPKDLFDWVSPKTFRRTVATLLADSEGVEVAADQLGHVSPEITRKHYWEKQRSGPDVRHILDRLLSAYGVYQNRKPRHRGEHRR